MGTTAPVFDADLTPFYIGDDYAVDHTITNLPSGQTVTQVTLGFKYAERDASPFFSLTITASPSASGMITNPGTPQADGTVTAEGVVTLTGGPAGQTATMFKAGVTYWWYLTCLTSAGAHYTSEHGTVSTRVGGPLG